MDYNYGGSVVEFGVLLWDTPAWGLPIIWRVAVRALILCSGDIDQDDGTLQPASHRVARLGGPRPWLRDTILSSELDAEAACLKCSVTRTGYSSSSFHPHGGWERTPREVIRTTKAWRAREKVQVAIPPGDDWRQSTVQQYISKRTANC